MDSRLAALALFVTAFAGAVTAAAQPQPPMQRDRPAVAREGTSVLKGRVVDAATGSAVPRARVRLRGPAGPHPQVLTDDSGRFTYTKLPGGPYTLVVDKPTYLSTAYPAAGRTVRSRMEPLVIKDGETIDAVTISLSRAGSIGGRVVDAYGDPVERAQIQVTRVPGSGRGGRPMKAHDSTDDIGEFRVGRLEPGSYLLGAMTSRGFSEEMAANDASSLQSVPTYYPGVVSIEQAQPITVERGQQVTGIEVMLAEGKPAMVIGTIIDDSGQPVTTNAYVNARSAGRDFAGMHAGGGGLRPDGTFRLQLAPGEYVLEAHVMSRTPGGRSSNERFGILRVSIGENAQEAVTIVVGSGATATGRIVFDGTSSPPPVSTPLPLSLWSQRDGETCRSGEVHVNADWTFSVDGLLGTCRVSGESMLGRWVLKGVLVNGEDFRARDMTFAPGQRLRNVQIVLTDRRSSVTFSVADEHGQRTKEYVALVFPTDTSLWEDRRHVRPYVSSRMTLAVAGTEAVALGGTRPEPQRARPETLPIFMPGEYYVVAVNDLEADDLGDPRVLERLVRHAVRVSVTEGSTTEVSLRRVKFYH